MKKHIFIMMLFALCLTSFQAHAQRYLPGMKGLQVTAGMADGVHWNSDTDFAYHIGAAYSVYTKNANRWVIGGEYLHKKYDYKDMQIPVEQFTAEGGYYLKFLSDRRKTFFLSLGLSALAGYEVSNKSEKLLPDGSTLLNKDCFIYGGALTLELEAYLTDRIALLVNTKERMLFGSDIGKFHTQVTKSRGKRRNTLPTGAWRLLPADHLSDTLFPAGRQREAGNGQRYGVPAQ